MTYTLRDAVHADLPAIRDIYNDAVLNTTAIWNETRSTSATARHGSPPARPRVIRSW